MTGKRTRQYYLMRLKLLSLIAEEVHWRLIVQGILSSLSKTSGRVDFWHLKQIWSWITGFAVGLQAIFDVSQCRTSARLQHASPQSISSYLSWGTIFDFTIYHLISLLLFQSDFVPYRPIKDGAVKRSSL
ncbi:uncharacterized protein L203_102899 [Cryptococcus depauperatus CBS 7841]|uniref:Uncharacterized protein n=1 Tax=Cryptococcus depauperatus CBS 7841 TaxID=1295531 RepID=A0AAJ8JSN2_9TREE